MSIKTLFFNLLPFDNSPNFFATNTRPRLTQNNLDTDKKVKDKYTKVLQIKKKKTFFLINYKRRAKKI